MDAFEKLMLENLKQYCGGACISNPESCDCFGHKKADEILDLKLTLEDIEDQGQIYQKEHCAFYDSHSWYIKKGLEQSEAIH